MTEKAFENALKDGIKRTWSTAHVRKVSSQYTGGLLDLWAKLPPLPGMWVELKFVKLPKFDGTNAPTKLKLELTDLQRMFILKENRAGGQAGWMVCGMNPITKHSIIMAGSSHDASYADPSLDDKIMVSIGRGYIRSPDVLLQLFEAITCKKSA